VDFPSNQTKYGLVRDGDWGQASIPVEDIRGEFIDLRMLSYEFVILEVNGASCQFALDDIYWSGGGELMKVSTTNSLLEEFVLKDNYPNPFNPVTTLRYEIAVNTNVKITIYDMMGRLVKILTDKMEMAGYKSIKWNGTNDRNEPVSAGLYLYTIQAGDYRKTRKMVLIK
jgi:hypothetical protein